MVFGRCNIVSAANLRDTAKRLDAAEWPKAAVC
jgi:hypothetical protein